MECGVTWEMMPEVHRKVRLFAKSRPETICMTHLSHAYPQGANLYFIFIGKFRDKEEYLGVSVRYFRQYTGFRSFHESPSRSGKDDGHVG